MVALASKLNQIIKYVDELYKIYVPPFQPKLERVGWEWVYSRIKKLPNFSGWVLRLDGYYYTTDYETFIDMIAWDWTDTREYLTDKFDCDKFAMYFKTRMSLLFGMNAIGVILDYGSGHAYNVVLFKGYDDPFLYEPQTDEIFSPEVRDKQFYALNGSYFVII